MKVYFPVRTDLPSRQISSLGSTYVVFNKNKKGKDTKVDLVAIPVVIHMPLKR